MGEAHDPIPSSHAAGLGRSEIIIVKSCYLGWRVSAHEPLCYSCSLHHARPDGRALELVDRALLIIQAPFSRRRGAKWRSMLTSYGGFKRPHPAVRC